MPSLPRKQPKLDTREGRQLRATVRVALAALFAYCVYRGWNLRGYEILLGIGCFALAAWPALHWTRAQPYRFPAFETFMLTGITAYVFPLVTDHAAVVAYSDEVVTKAMIGVFLFQLCAIGIFVSMRPTERTTPFWTKPLFVTDIRRYLPIGLWLHVAYLFVGTFTDWVPPEIDSVLRAVSFGISTSCSFLLGRYWGDGELPRSQKSNVIIAMALEVILQLMTLYLITAISGLIVFFLAYISAGRRVPWVMLGSVFVLFSVLHNGKNAMREKYWAEGVQPPGMTELPSFFGEWVQHGFEPSAEERLTPKSPILERASLLHMLCLVIDSTDKGLPLLMGDTYGDILPQLVPRIVWQDKPTGQISSMRLSVYFGLQDINATRYTSIAFGTLAESYANFGLLGMAMLGALVGWAGKVISIWTRSCPLLSNGGLIMILVMAWSIQIELPLSVWIASIYQAAICVLLLPHAVRIFIQ